MLEGRSGEELELVANENAATRPQNRIMGQASQARTACGAEPCEDSEYIFGCEFLPSMFPDRLRARGRSDFDLRVLGFDGGSRPPCGGRRAAQL
jgi:hypothetical protein